MPELLAASGLHHPHKAGFLRDKPSPTGFDRARASDGYRDAYHGAHERDGYERDGYERGGDGDGAYAYDGYDGVGPRAGVARRVEGGAGAGGRRLGAGNERARPRRRLCVARPRTPSGPRSAAACTHTPW